MNIFDGDGYSPYQKAVKSANAKIIRYLLRNGPDMKPKNIDGNSSSEVVLRRKRLSIFKLLVLYSQ